VAKKGFDRRGVGFFTVRAWQQGKGGSWCEDPHWGFVIVLRSLQAGMARPILRRLKPDETEHDTPRDTRITGYRKILAAEHAAGHSVLLFQVGRYDRPYNARADIEEEVISHDEDSRADVVTAHVVIGHSPLADGTFPARIETVTGASRSAIEAGLNAILYSAECDLRQEVAEPGGRSYLLWWRIKIDLETEQTVGDFLRDNEALATFSVVIPDTTIDSNSDRQFNVTVETTLSTSELRGDGVLGVFRPILLRQSKSRVRLRTQQERYDLSADCELAPESGSDLVDVDAAVEALLTSAMSRKSTIVFRPARLHQHEEIDYEVVVPHLVELLYAEHHAG